jgi:hypothetical protein
VNEREMNALKDLWWQEHLCNQFGIFIFSAFLSKSAKMRLLASVYLSIRPLSPCFNSKAADRIIIKFDVLTLFNFS